MHHRIGFLCPHSSPARPSVTRATPKIQTASANEIQSFTAAIRESFTSFEAGMIANAAGVKLTPASSVQAASSSVLLACIPDWLGTSSPSMFLYLYSFRWGDGVYEADSVKRSSKIAERVGIGLSPRSVVARIDAAGGREPCAHLCLLLARGQRLFAPACRFSCCGFRWDDDIHGAGFTVLRSRTATQPRMDVAAFGILALPMLCRACVNALGE